MNLKKDMTKNGQKLKELIEYPKQGIVSKEIIKTDSLDVGLFCMSKGTEMSNHTSTKEGTVFIVEGQGVFNLEGEDIEMSPNTLIYMKKNAVHSLRAESNLTFVLTLFSAS